MAGAIRKLTADDILAYEAAGQLEVGGALLEAGELKVLREFRAPEGVGAEDMDAAGDGEVGLA